MQPKSTEIVIVNLRYEKDKKEPSFMTRFTDRIGTSMAVFTEWFTEALFREKCYMYRADCPETIILREWRITTGDETLFQMEEQTHDQVYLVLGYELMHWIYYKEGYTKSGITLNLPSYCGCCIRDQYEDILRDFLRERWEYWEWKQSFIIEEN